MTSSDEKRHTPESAVELARHKVLCDILYGAVDGAAYERLTGRPLGAFTLRVVGFAREGLSAAEMVAFISGLPQCRNAAVFASAQCRVAALEERGKIHAPGAPGMPGGIRAAACIAFGPDAAIEEETVQGCGADELRWFYGECDRALAERLAAPAGLAQRGVKPVLAKAMDYMAEHYGAPLTLGDVARFAFASTCYISRLFMRELGMSFVDYLTALRMEKARRLLRGTRLKVFEVAELCGISDAHYFAKLFRRSTGFSPSEYRKDIKL